MNMKRAAANLAAIAAFCALAACSHGASFWPPGLKHFSCVENDSGGYDCSHSYVATAAEHADNPWYIATMNVVEKCAGDDYGERETVKVFYTADGVSPRKHGGTWEFPGVVCKQDQPPG